MFPLATILHPTDFSPPSVRAFELACSLARDHGGRLVVLHVAEPPVVGQGGAMTPPSEGDWMALEGRLQHVGSNDPGVPIERRLMEGNPVAEILRVSQDVRADLIVMGTHGRTGLGHLLMGSVAEQVVRRAICPVLVVKSLHPETEPGEH